MKHTIIAIIAALVITACSNPSVPTDAVQSSAMPKIFPDYTEVTVPSNICPLNFMLNDGSAEAVARLSVGDKSCVYGEGHKIYIDEAEWAELRTLAKGKDITVEVFGMKNGTWTAYKPFKVYVAEEEIDPYLSYRNIQPGYVTYHNLYINQRDITTFEETTIYDNEEYADDEEKGGQCINCHSYQNYKTDNMLFHMRQMDGGTMFVSNGKVKKVDLKTDSTISAGVYPSWHPTKNLVAFSTNKTGQIFFTKSNAKIEVFDQESDLILYDVDKNEVMTVSQEPDEFEIFPCWSADGKTLYYGSAHFAFNPNDTASHESQVMARYEELKYNIYSRTFDEKTRRFSSPQLVFDAAALGKSATLYRVSPDGRYMVFSLGNYGCFHVWHPEADIYLMDLATGKAAPLAGINSNRSESYPSFSSNGRWVMTASRRDDGNYTRPYIAYFDKQGKCRKPFELPQKDPEYYTLFLMSYNRPEFMSEPVKIPRSEFVEKAKTEAVKAKYSR